MARCAAVPKMDLKRQSETGKIMPKKNSKTLETNHNAAVDVGPRLVSLEIDQIKLYDGNPRTSRNPEYERLKYSIANHGLEQPLIVTRRPSESAYIVKSGGNTRLQILKELYAATGDPYYGIADCIEVNWQDEASVLLGHLLENSVRGNLTFIDQATAISAYGEMLAESAGASRLSIRELYAALKEKGLPTSVGALSRMRYAVDVLSSAMPVALSDGLGHRKIAEISKLHRNARQLWVRTELGSESDFDNVFAVLCRRYDGPDWQFEPLQRAVEIEIAEAGNVGVQTVRMSIDSLKLAVLTVPTATNPSQQLELQDKHRSLRIADDLVSTPRTGGADETSTEPMLTVSVELNCGRDSADQNTETKQNCPFVDLRRRAYDLATSLASSFKFGELIMPLPDCGNGFLLTDLPDTGSLERVDSDARATLGTTWWQLLAFSETASAPVEVVQDRLPSDSALRQILEQASIELLFDRIDIVNAAHFADRFWARLPKKEWQDWLYLAHTHREIRQKVVELDRPLWSRTP